MPRRYERLFGQIANFQALHDAARRAIKGKRKKPGAASFFANLEGELLALERQLRDGKYRPVPLGHKDVRGRPLFALQTSQRAYLVTLHRMDTRRAVLRPADV